MTVPVSAREYRKHLIVLAMLLVQPFSATAVGSAISQQVRDSAGVLIANIPDVLEADGSGWIVTPEPSVVLRAGANGEELFQVTGALVLRDGSIVVGEEASGRISIFGSDGNFLQSHGRRGEGPGEYKRPVVVGVLGSDTLVVVDGQQRRLSLVHVREGFLTSSRLREDLGSPVSPRGMFGDRTVVVGGGHSWTSGASETVTSGYSRPRTRYCSANLDGSIAADFGAFPGIELIIEVIELPDGGSSMSADPLPFGKRSVLAVGSDFLYTGTQDDWQIRAFDPSGALRRILRLNRTSRRVRSGDVDAMLQKTIDEASDLSAAPSIRREFARLPFPETMPAFSSLHTDPLGFIWVERYRSPSESVPVFDVVSPDGYLVTEVSLTDGNRIFQIGDDHVLTLHTDLLDVESVRLYPLARASYP